MRKEDSEYLMNNPIPSKSRIIDNNVNLPTTKLSSFLHKLFDVLSIQHIADNRQRAPRSNGIDPVSD
jgi:hypothetical protein